MASLSLMTLNADVLAVVAASVRRRERFMLRLTCRRAAALYTGKTKTPLHAVVESEALLAWARGVGVPWTPSICAAAARRGKWSVMRRAHALGLAYDAKTAAFAAAKGNAGVMEEIRRSLSCPLDVEECLRMAARHGNRSTTAWILKHAGDDDDDFEAWREAVSSAPISYLEFFLEATGLDETPVTTFYLAACNGRTDVLRWAVERERHASDSYYLKVGDYGSICDVAAEHGHFETLQQAIRLGFTFSEVSIESAARAGRLDTLAFLRDKTWTTDEMWDGACEAAAWGGDLPALRFLRSVGCPWNESVAIAAAQRGLELLRYVVEHGCPVPEGIREQYVSFLEQRG